MTDVVWQLPVKQSNKTNHDWIHPKAKYHAFINGASICGKYFQDVEFFENKIEEDELISQKKQYACLKCLNKLQRGLNKQRELYGEYMSKKMNVR